MSRASNFGSTTVSVSTAVGIRLTIYSKQTEEDEARDRRRRIAAPRLHLRRAAAIPRQTADAAELPQSRRNGHGGLSQLAGNSPDRLSPRQRRRSAARLCWQPHRPVAQRGPAQRAGSHHATLAGRTRRADAGSPDRRPRLLRTRHQDRLPAHRHVSHSGCLRHQRRHSRLRGLLALAQAALRRDLGHHPHHPAFLGICLRRRSGLAHRARDHHAQYLPAYSIAVSRSRRT